MMTANDGNEAETAPKIDTQRAQSVAKAFHPPLTEEDLDTYLSLVGEHGALAPTPARYLIAELRALRKAARVVCDNTVDGLDYLPDDAPLSCFYTNATFGEVRRLRDLLA